MQKNLQQQKTHIGDRPYFYKVIHAEKVLIRGPILLCNRELTGQDFSLQRTED